MITFPFVILIKILRPKREETIEKKARKLKKAHRHLSIERFYLAKILFPILIFILLFTLYQTNFKYTTREIIESNIYGQMDITLGFMGIEDPKGKELYSDSSVKGYSEYVEKEWMYYQFLIKNYEKADEILYTPQDKVITAYQDLLVKQFPLDEIEALHAARRMNYKMTKIANYQFSKNYYFIIFLSYFLPDLIVYLIMKYKEYKYKTDIPVLKLATYLMGSMDVTVRDIMECLRETSNTYRGVFSNALSNINAVQLGRENAILQMAEEVPNPQFRKLCVILKDLAIRNKSRALKNLEDDIVMEARENMMRSEDKIEKKTWIAIILIIPTMFFLALLLLMPFVRYQQNLNF